MTIRLPEPTDQKFDELAARKNTSKHALLVQAAEKFLHDEDQQQRVDRAFDRTFERYNEVMERLADA